MIEFINSINNDGYIALFAIVTVGIIIGKIKIKNFSFDLSAVIFAGLIFGYFGFVVPHQFLNIGLLLFIFTIGIQAGPGFFEAFKAYGRQLIITTVVIILSAAITTFAAIKIFDVDVNLAAGVYTGAMTSTPGLAVATELSNSPLAPVGYGIAYIFGVLGVIIFINMLPWILRINIKKQEKEYLNSVEENHPKIFGQNFIVENDSITNKTLAQIHFSSMTGTRISRIKHMDKAVTPSKDTILHLGDLVRVVGTAESVKKAGYLVGSETTDDIQLSEGYQIEWILVTNKKIINKSYSEIGLSQAFNTTVLKIKRSGIEITPKPNSIFRYGDRLQVSTDSANINAVTQLLGNDTKKLSSTDFLPIFAGILIGIALGKIQIPIFGLNFNLGITGGTLAAGIILSRIGKTGPIIWSMSGTANHLLRELGLLLFMATVGTEAGSHVAETLQSSGLQLFIIGAVITIIPMVMGTLVGKYIFKMNFLILLGVISGAMTSTPGLVIANSKSDANAAPIAYAAVYPVALVLVIITTQILLLL